MARMLHTEGHADNAVHEVVKVGEGSCLHPFPLLVRGFHLL